MKACSPPQGAVCNSAYERFHEFRQFRQCIGFGLFLVVCELFCRAGKSGLEGACQKQVAEETNEFDALSVVSRYVRVVLCVTTIIGIELARCRTTIAADQS